MGSLKEIELEKSQSAYSNSYHILGLALACNTFNFNSCLILLKLEKQYF